MYGILYIMIIIIHQLFYETRRRLTTSIDLLCNYETSIALILYNNKCSNDSTYHSLNIHTAIHMRICIIICKMICMHIIDIHIDSYSSCGIETHTQ